MPTDLLACVFQQLAPTADQVAAAAREVKLRLLHLKYPSVDSSASSSLRQPEVDAYRDEDDQEFEMEMDEEDEIERQRTRMNALKRVIDADVARKIDVIRHVLACALVCHSGHVAVRAWMQNLVNQSALNAVALRRIRRWQLRTDSSFVDVLARPLRTDDSVLADGVPSLQGFAEGLYSTLRSTLKSLPVFEAAVAAAALAAAAGDTPISRLHLRRPAAEAFVLILEADVIRLLAAAMRARVFRMQDEEDDTSVESRDIIFCIKERMDTHDGNGASGGQRFPQRSGISRIIQGPHAWLQLMPLWLILSFPFEGSVFGGKRLKFDDMAIVTEQLVAAGPTLEVQLAIVQRLAARAGIKRFSGNATKLIWQYVSLQAAALLVRATAPVRDLIFPQREHKKRVEDGLSEASEEEEEMSSADEQEMNHAVRMAEAQEESGSEESGSEQDVEEGDECDARWDEEESEWVLLPSTACFEGAAGWLRDGLRPRTLFYLGLPEKVSKSTEAESPESLLNHLQL